MKICKIILIAVFLFTSLLSAQERKTGNKFEQVKSLKIAHITSELALTPEEASTFWPIYNSYEEKQRELKKRKIRNYSDRIDQKALDAMTDKEASAALSQMENTDD